MAREKAMTRITAFLSVRSKTSFPSQISGFLEVTADREVVKGSLRTPPKPRPESHGWNISCVFEEYVDIDVAIKALSKRLDGKTENLLLARKRHVIDDVSVKIAIAPAGELIPMFLSEETVKFLGNIGASLDIEYFPE